MKPAFDLTSIRLTLRRMVEKGYLRDFAPVDPPAPEPEAEF